jgi:hypothetical protein
MLLINSLPLVLLIFINVASAFYPFIPDYRCLYSHTCTPEKRAVENSLKIVQRLPNVILSYLELEIFGLILLHRMTFLMIFKFTVLPNVSQKSTRRSAA